ncbi:MAG: glycosyltransferase family 4 protein [Candidatus Saccharimonadales bacterium]
MKKLKILHTVEFYYPSIGGAQEVVRHLSERMVQQGHDVTVATSYIKDRDFTEYNGVKIVDFKITGNAVNGLRGEKKKYQDFLKNSDFDVVMNYAAQQWTADAFFEVIDDVSAKKVFVPCGYSALYDPNYEDYFTKLPETLKKYDATVYLADHYRDIDFAREHKLKNIKVIPNGADENEFTERISEEAKKLLKNRYGVGGLVLMTTGNYTGEKGHRELLSLFKRLPVSHATLVSAGTLKPHDGCFDWFVDEAWKINQSRKFPGKRVVMLDGTDRETVKNFMKAADIFVFLSNIECSPLVLFEAAAAGTPFLTSEAGNSAEIAQWTGAGIVVKSHARPNGRVTVDSKDALWKLTKLAHQPARRVELGETGHKTWKKKYTWDKLTDTYLSLYQDLTKKRK